jgi:hypothetical protein
VVNREKNGKIAHARIANKRTILYKYLYIKNLSEATAITAFLEIAVNDNAIMKKKDTHTLCTKYPQVFHNLRRRRFTGLLPS